MAAVLIAYCALGFTLGSFWWLHVRRGQLVASPPMSFGWYCLNKVRIRLPLIVENTGPVPLVVEDMELIVGDDIVRMPWISLRTKIRPQAGDDIDFATSTLIPGRNAIQLFVEFGIESLDVWSPEPSSRQDLRLRVRERQSGWSDLVTFAIELPGEKVFRTNMAHRAIGCDCG